MSQVWYESLGVIRNHREVHPHSRNQNIPSSPSMNLDSTPPVRPLLTHVIADEPLRREAGIITLLLDERPTLAFELLTPAYESSRASLGVVLLEVRVKALAACQSETGVGPRKTVVGESDLLEDVILLGLKGGDLVGEARGLDLALVVLLELSDEAPVVQTFGFLDEDGEGLGVGREDADEPRWEGVRHGLAMIGGGGIEFVGVDRVGWSPKASQCVGAVRGALDVRRHHLIPVRPRNEETRELIVVDLPPVGGGDLSLLWCDTTSPPDWESGGVVA